MDYSSSRLTPGPRFSPGSFSRTDLSMVTRPHSTSRLSLYHWVPLTRSHPSSTCLYVGKRLSYPLLYTPLKPFFLTRPLHRRSTVAPWSTSFFIKKLMTFYIRHWCPRSFSPSLHLLLPSLPPLSFPPSLPLPSLLSSVFLHRLV